MRLSECRHEDSQLAGGEAGDDLGLAAAQEGGEGRAEGGAEEILPVQQHPAHSLEKKLVSCEDPGPGQVMTVMRSPASLSVSRPSPQSTPPLMETGEYR